MSKTRNLKQRKMLPQILIICEGETEEVYIDMLKQNYRLPIRIVSKVLGNKISNKLIERIKKAEKLDQRLDKTFMVYDGDVSSVLGRLKTCKEITFISYPCIEVWFLAHLSDIVDVEMQANECIDRLRTVKRWEDYKKGWLSNNQQKDLWDNRFKAVKVAKSNVKATSNLYKLIELLEEENKNRCLC